MNAGPTSTVTPPTVVVCNRPPGRPDASYRSIVASGSELAGPVGGSQADHSPADD